MSLVRTIILVAYERDKEIVFRPLYESPIVSVHDYCCHIERGGPGAEEESDANNIVLMRHGAFSRHFGESEGRTRRSTLRKTLDRMNRIFSGFTCKSCSNPVHPVQIYLVNWRYLILCGVSAAAPSLVLRSAS